MPLIGSSSPDYSGLLKALSRVAVFYGIGILCAYSFNRIMVTVTQHFLRDIRNELFEHMESLPIRYFDQTTHGDIMSIYTNDTDTLRQLISQSIPQVVSSGITIVTVFITFNCCELNHVNCDVVFKSQSGKFICKILYATTN